MSFLGDSRNYLRSKEEVVLSLVPKRCGNCALAHNIALDVVEEARAGEIPVNDIGRTYDLRIGSVCLVGQIELSDEVVCLQDPDAVERPTIP